MWRIVSFGLLCLAVRLSPPVLNENWTSGWATIRDKERGPEETDPALATSSGACIRPLDKRAYRRFGREAQEKRN